MPELFGKGQTYKANNFVTADQLILQVGLKDDITEYLVQNIAFQYNQPINRVYEIGSSFVYFASGRSLGTVQIGRLVGEKLITELLGPPGTGPWSTDLSKGLPSSRVVRFKKIREDQNSSALINYILVGCVVEGYAIAVDANSQYVQENVTMQFAGLYIPD